MKNHSKTHRKPLYLYGLDPQALQSPFKNAQTPLTNTYCHLLVQIPLVKTFISPFNKTKKLNSWLLGTSKKKTI